MKRTLRKTLAIILAALMLICSVPLAGLADIDLPDIGSFFAKAETATSGTCGKNLTWTFDGSTGALTISGTGDMYSWSYSFSVPWDSSRSLIKSVKIENGVTSIGDYAFSDCDSLTSVSIPDSVTSIGHYAFRYCTSLASITIPDSVTSIGHDAFRYCTSLASVTIGNSVTSIGDYAFCSCDSLESITIPDSVTSIGFEAFYSCDSLTSVTLGNSVTSIGDYAFQYCTSLASVTIPDSVTSIGEKTFYSCDNLASITIPDSVTSIDSIAFSYRTQILCKKNSFAHDYASENSYAYWLLDDESQEKTYSGKIGTKLIWSIDRKTRTLTIDNNGTMVSFSSETAPWIQYEEYIRSVKINYGCTNISDKAFYDCNYLESVEIPYSVTTIGGSAFYYCNSLTSVTIPDSVTSIGSGAFYYCTSLASVTIGNGVTSIGNYAFENCDSLTSITIPDSVTIIYPDAFNSCSSLTSVTIGNSVTSIGYNAFYFCSSLTSVTIGNSVTSIRDYAFSYCQSLASITIPDSVTSIGSYAFYNCSSLTSITIPDSVTSIGSDAFYSCDSLEIVTIGSGLKNLYSQAFAYCPKLSDIYFYSKNCSISSNAITVYATIHGYTGSTAETFAEKYGYEFIPIVDSPCNVHSYTNSCDIYCDVCGFKREITHSFGDWVITKEPTCSAFGVKKQTCTVCGYSQSDKVDKLTDHKYDDECDVSCKWCGKIREVPHAFGNWVVTKEPTCAEYGLKERICSLCNTKDTDSVAKLTEHIYTDDCDADCNSCGEKRAVAHDYGEWVVTKEPTCAEEGVKERTCSVSGCVETEKVPTVEHTYGEWTVIQEPTCKMLGIKECICSVCGTSKTTYVDMLMHEYADNCDDKCDICGETRTTSHNYGEWVVTKDPTCAEEGIKERTCSVSGCVETEKLPKLEHTSGEWFVTKEPTCSIYGSKEIKCSVCGEVLETEEIPATGHMGGTWETVLEPTTEAEGKKVKKCAVCDVILEEAAIAKLPKEPVKDNAVVKSPSTSTISYGDAIILHVDESKIPAGGRVEWTASNGNFSYKADGATCIISPAKSGDTTFTATIYDADGNAVSTDEQTMTSKAGFFDKIIAFFKGIFGLTKTYPDIFGI